MTGLLTIFSNAKILVPALASCLVLNSVTAGELPPPTGPAIEVPLTVSAGVPLRVYITKRLRMRTGEPVRAKLIEPIYAFDRVVVPSGSELQGRITTLDPVPKMRRFQAILNGDFTPLHFARVQFTTIAMPDGKSLPIEAADSEGLPTIYSPPRPSKKKPGSPSQNTGVMGTAKQQAQQQIQRQISTRTQGVADMVRGPNKKENLEDFLITKLPYHPQWYRRNTRFDAILSSALDFGSVQVSREALTSIGTPGGEFTGQVRLATRLSSADASTGTPVSGVLSQPIFSPDHKLILPEGTLLTGRVRQVQPARMFHRGGKLRFTFDRVEPPAFALVPAISIERTPAMLAAAETDPRARIKVGSEGDAKATESKSRLLAPVVALLVASRAGDNDEGRKATSGANANYGGRTLGGFSGFGYLGSAAAQSSKTLGAVLGYYGLAWTVYSTIVSRGKEVEFQKNTAMDVRFGANPAKPNLNSRFLAQR